MHLVVTKELVPMEIEFPVSSARNNIGETGYFQARAKKNIIAQSDGNCYLILSMLSPHITKFQEPQLRKEINFKCPKCFRKIHGHKSIS